MKRFTLVSISLLLLTATSCFGPPQIKTTDDTVELLDGVDRFYTFLIGREVGNRHNDQDEKFLKLFLDKKSYYDFLDTYIPLVKDRNLLYNTIHEYYVLGIEMAEDGASARVEIKVLSRDAPLLYRKIEMTHNWSKSYDKWYPGKVEAPMLTKWTKLIDLYALPPKRR